MTGYPAQHYTLFPLTLGQILREYAVTELHLSLNAGKWNYDTWGMPDELGVATGGELWAWIADGASMSYVRSFSPLCAPIVLIRRLSELTSGGKGCVTHWQGCSVHLLAQWTSNERHHRGGLSGQRELCPTGVMAIS